MGREASCQREEERDEDHGQADDGEKNMRRQQKPEIDEARRGIGAWKEHVAVQDMVDDVGDEEDARDDERAEHAVAVFDDLASTNVAKADDRKMAQSALRTASSAGRKARCVPATSTGGW